MREKLEKYDKLITAALVIVAFILGIGYWFAEEKSEPEYLSKIDRLMFDKDNKAPKLVLTLPDKLVATNKKEDVFVDVIQEAKLMKEPPVLQEFSFEKLLAKVPNLSNLPSKPATQKLDYTELEERLTDTSKEGFVLPKISEDGRKPWSEYGMSVEVQPNFKKVAVVIAGLGFDPNSVDKIAKAFDSEVSMSFTPYTPKPYEAITTARNAGHETYVDLLLSSRDFLKEDTGPLSLNLNLSLEGALERFYKTISKPAPLGGVIIRDGIANDNNAIILRALLGDAKNRGLLIVDATSENGIANIKISGLARRKADIVINKDMTGEEIEKLLQTAENIAFDKGQVLIVSDAKPLAVMALYNWIKTFSPQISYEEAKTIEISKPFALVPLSNLVVE